MKIRINKLANIIFKITPIIGILSIVLYGSVSKGTNVPACPHCEYWNSVSSACVAICPAGQSCCYGTLFVQCYDLATQGCCNGVIYDATTSCCSPSGTIVPKDTITNLSDCPNRIARPPPYEATVNGCGGDDWLGVIVPNEVSPCANFVQACNTHDWCYGTCAVDAFGQADTSHNFDECNAQFQTDLEAVCTACYAAGLQRNACLNAAVTYFQAVNNFGLPHWAAGQRAGCICCP